MVSPSPSLTAAPQRPVLLVFTPAASVHQPEVDRLLEQARSGLNPTLQIMRVSETTHPEVVRSFGFSALPAFVLLRQGLELWRYSGPIDSPGLFSELNSQLQQTCLPIR